MNDSTENQPVNAWADFKQRWLAVRDRIATWWAGADRKTVVGAAFLFA